MRQFKMFRTSDDSKHLEEISIRIEEEINQMVHDLMDDLLALSFEDKEEIASRLIKSFNKVGKEINYPGNAK